MQPYPGASLVPPWIAMIALLIVAAIAVVVMQPRRVILDKTYDLEAVAASPEGTQPNARVFFTDPFELTGRGNVEVKAGAALDNSWLWLGVDLVDEAAGQLRSIEIPLEYYSGVDGC